MTIVMMPLPLAAIACERGSDTVAPNDRQSFVVE
jgi:hypothetical protein